MILVYHVISQDRVIRGSCDFLSKLSHHSAKHGNYTIGLVFYVISENQAIK